MDEDFYAFLKTSEKKIIKPLMKKKITIITVASILFLPLLMMVSQTIFTWVDQYRFQPFGKKIRVNGHNFHYLYTGSGPYTVVLDAGLGQGLVDWSLVQPQLAEFTRVFSYDRSGYGWSEETTSPKTCDQIAEDLHALLTQANIKKPFILVGHSFGGLNMQLYYSKYREDVQGIVLVDSCHPKQLEKLPPPPTVLSIQKNNHLFMTLLAKLGISRIILQIPSQKKLLEKILPFDDQTRKAWIAEASSAKYIRTMLREEDFFEENLAYVGNQNISFEEIPLTIIVAGKESSYDNVHLPEEVLEWQRKYLPIWHELQRELASKSSLSNFIIAKESDHMIPRNQPNIVVQSIKELILSLPMDKSRE